MTRLKIVGVAAALGTLTMLTLPGPTGAAPLAKPLSANCTGVVTDIGATFATWEVDTTEACAIFDNKKGQGGKLLNRVDYQFVNRGDVGGGSPRFSIPINDGSFDPGSDYAFLDPINCGAAEGDNPGNTATLVSTQNPNCKVHFKGADYANWDRLALEFPTYKTANGWLPFIISDSLPTGQSSATYSVTNVFFG